MYLTFDEEFAIFKQYIPDGGVWSAKNKDTNLRAVLYAIVSMFYKAKKYSYDLSTSLNISNIDQYCIEEWERLAGIPDAIFNKDVNTLTLEERTNNVITKLTGLNISTRQEVKNFIKLLYPYITNITFKNASNNVKFPLTFPIIFGKAKQLKKLVLIKLEGISSGGGFPLTFPYTFGQSTTEVENFLNYIIPFPYRIKFI